MSEVQLRGPSGIVRRMEEIRARMAALSGHARGDGPEVGAPVYGPGTPPNRVPSGMIGNATVSNYPVGSGGVPPLNPFGPGMGLDSAGAPGVSQRSAFRIPTAPPGLAPLITRAAQSAGIDPKLLDAVVAAESSYDPNARSRAGALGLAQLMPGTAAELGVRNPFDPFENLSGGARYLSQMLARFGDVRTALAAYNAGPGAVERAGGIPDYPETRRYVDRVLEIYQARNSG